MLKKHLGSLEKPMWHAEVHFSLTIIYIEFYRDRIFPYDF